MEKWKFISDERWRNGNLEIDEANHSEERNVNMSIQRCKTEDKIGFELKTDEANPSELPIGIVVIRKEKWKIKTKETNHSESTTGIEMIPSSSSTALRADAETFLVNVINFSSI